MPTLSHRRHRAAAACFLLATSLLAVAAPAPARADAIGILAVSCTTHRANTAGWANCSGTGQARLVIDCKAPQVSDYWSDWRSFNNSSGTISGECWFGINSVGVQTR